jgi:hypothetical protein
MILFRFNKSLNDFPSLKEYCDYQEMTEDIIFNLLHGIDEEETEARIELYQTENMQLIRERQSQLAEEERRIEMQIKREQEEAANLAQQIQVKLPSVSNIKLSLGKRFDRETKGSIVEETNFGSDDGSMFSTSLCLIKIGKRYNFFRID